MTDNFKRRLREEQQRADQTIALEDRIEHITVMKFTSQYPGDQHTYVAFQYNGRACSCGHQSGNLPNLREVPNA